MIQIAFTVHRGIIRVLPVTSFATTPAQWKSGSRSDLLSLCLVLLLVALMLTSLTIGRYPLSLREVGARVLHDGPL